MASYDFDNLRFSFVIYKIDGYIISFTQEIKDIENLYDTYQDLYKYGISISLNANNAKDPARLILFFKNLISLGSSQFTEKPYLRFIVNDLLECTNILHLKIAKVKNLVKCTWDLFINTSSDQPYLILEIENGSFNEKFLSILGECLNTLNEYKKKSKQFIDIIKSQSNIPIKEMITEINIRGDLPEKITEEFDFLIRSDVFGRENCGIEISQLPIIAYDDIQGRDFSDYNFNIFLKQLKEIPKKSFGYLFLKLLLLLNITRIIFIFTHPETNWNMLSELIDLQLNRLLDYLISKNHQSVKERLEFTADLLSLFDIELQIKVTKEIVEKCL